MDPSRLPDQVVIDTPSLTLPIDDNYILAVLNEAEMKGNTAKSKENIDDRANSNVEFWKGNQVDETKLDKRYQEAHVDNVVHEKLEDQIRLASAKIPDIFVAPPDKQDFNMEASRDIQQWLRERIDSGTIKRLIKNGLRKMNLKYLAGIKPRWDYAKRDFVFELVDGKDLLFAEGSKILEDGFTIDGTDLFFHYVEEPTSVVLAKFKKKADALRAEIGRLNRNQMPSRIRYSEVHFRWYDEQGRLGEGVCWRYGNVILDKMREPYYDYDNPEINYFDRPRKPLILFSYMNLGDSVYETTTTFEQGKPVNRMINKRRRQVTEISDRAVPKLAFSGGAMTTETARNISPSPNQGIVLNDSVEDIRQAMMVIPAVPPNPILYNDMADLRGRLASMFSTSGSQAASVGNDASGVSKQISRESDMVTSDDISEVVIERVVTEIAEWAMQFARLFYDDDRPPVRRTNEEGDTNFIELTRQKLETDVQVVVKGSTNDKTTRRNDAIQMLTGKITDPYTIFEDLDVPNPKERTRRLLSFIQAQQAGDWTKYTAVIGVDLEEDRASEEDAQRDIELLIQGGQPNISATPTEAYVSTFMAFVKSQDFANLDPQSQQRVQQHIEQLKQKVAEEAAKQGGDQDPNAPQTPGQALQGAPGVQGQVAYQPQVDTSTQFSQGGGIDPNTLAALQQRIQMPAPAQPAPAPAPPR